MIGEIISIGDELLIGQVINTNASWIGEHLAEAGIRITQISSIGDEGSRIKEALDEALERADVIIMTGGLGPTRDDITKSVLCDYFDTKLVYDESVFQHITQLFRGRNLIWNKLNKGQAYVPEACTLLHNPNGTAPGMWFEKGKKVIISLPGVPLEMKSLVRDLVIPKLLEAFPNQESVYHQTVFTQGIPESRLATQIEEWETGLPPHMKLAYLPRAGMVRLRISAVGESEEILKQQVEAEIAKLHKILPGEVFGQGEENLERVIGELLGRLGKSLSTAESCTGGYIAHMITSVPGSSQYFKGSIVSYANEIKEDLLNVNKSLIEQHGAVSEEVVMAMAKGACDKLGSDYSVAVSGIAGPDGGTAEKPVGTVWIAIGTPTKIITKQFLFGRSRERNIQQAAFSALNLLRKELNS